MTQTTHSRFTLGASFGAIFNSRFRAIVAIAGCATVCMAVATVVPTAVIQTPEVVVATVQSADAMTLEFRRTVITAGDTFHQVRTISFAHNVAEGSWDAQDPSIIGKLGVIFGRTRLRFATGAALQMMGIEPTDAVRGLDPSIVGRSYEDVTVIRTSSGEVGVCLWKKGLIAEIWFSGRYIQSMIEILPDVEDCCAAAVKLCCATKTVGVPGSEVIIPNPRLDACASVAAECPDLREAACQCLFTACGDCHPTACPDPARQSASDDACIQAVNSCGPITSEEPPAKPPWADEILQLLREILERLQRIHDTMPIES